MNHASHLDACEAADVLESLLAMVADRGAMGVEVVLMLDDGTCVYRVTGAMDRLRLLAGESVGGVH